MSWHGGRRVFEAVVGAVEARDRGEVSAKQVMASLIRALRDEDWDVGEANVALLAADSPAREALREVGVVETCGAEEGYKQCEEEVRHYPATPHKDYFGNVWNEEG